MVWYEWLHRLIWNWMMLPAILFLGGYFLVKTRFYPVFHIRTWMKQTIGEVFFPKKDGEKRKRLSGFQAACTSLAASLGTGNIAGVATALTAGGPGAIFWMWVSALLGMMVQYGEIALAVLYQKKERDGGVTGGPIQYMERGLGKKSMAKCYGVFCILASFGIGNMTQVNSMVQGLQETFSIPTALSGTVCCVLLGAVLAGGVKRIGNIAEKLIPLVSIGYIGAALVFLFFHISQLGEAFSSIFQEAFRIRSGIAGVTGYSMKHALTMGLARGTFSHEAGMGSGAFPHGSTEGASPEKQGMWGIFQVFFDTMVMCTITALVILVSGAYHTKAYGEMVALTGGCGSFLDGASLTEAAFGTLFGQAGKQLVAICLTLFAFSTLMAWAYYGEVCFCYLFGHRFSGWYRFTYLLAVPAGAAGAVSVIWELADICNGLMAIPNLIALYLLRKKITKFVAKIKE